MLSEIENENSDVFKLLLNLQKASVSDIKLLITLKNIYENKQAKNVTSSVIESANKFSNINIDESALLRYVETQMKHPSKNKTEFIKNYISQFSPIFSAC